MKRLVSVVVMVGAFVAPAMPAHAVTAPRVLSYAMPNVYVVDKAPAWPVRRAVAVWGRSRYLDIVVVPSCPVTMYGRGVDCVVVRDGGRRAGYDGMTYPTTARYAGALRMVSARVYLYDRPMPASMRFEVTLHELGHAIGLPHIMRRSSIMWPISHEQWSPSSYDYALIARAYAGVQW